MPKAKRILFQLNSCCAKTYGPPSFCIKQIYTSIFEPILLYGCFAWCKGIAKLFMQTKLKGTQRLAAIRVLRSFKTISYQTGIALTQMLPIIDRGKERRITTLIRYNKHYHHYEHVTSNHIAELYNMTSTFNLDPDTYESPASLLEYPASYDYKPINASIQDTESSISTAKATQKSTETHIYTDGSNIQRKIGCSIICNCPNPLTSNSRAYKLQPENTVY